MTLATCLTSTQAAQLLRDARIKLDRMEDDEPLQSLDATIDDLTPRSAAGDADARGRLMAAITQRDGLRKLNAERQARRAELTKQIAHYTSEQNRLEAEERAAAANEARSASSARPPPSRKRYGHSRRSRGVDADGYATASFRAWQC